MLCIEKLITTHYNDILLLVYGGECDNNRCENGGRCLKMAASHVCDCVNGHTGLLCEHGKYIPVM